MFTAAQTCSVTQWPYSASELYRPSDRRLSTKLVPIFLRVEGIAWSAQRIPTAVNLGFLYRKLAQYSRCK
jgi:hypothetical protein